MTMNDFCYSYADRRRLREMESEANKKYPITLEHDDLKKAYLEKVNDSTPSTSKG